MTVVYHVLFYNAPDFSFESLIRYYIKPHDGPPARNFGTIQKYEYVECDGIKMNVRKAEKMPIMISKIKQTRIDDTTRGTDV